MAKRRTIAAALAVLAPLIQAQNPATTSPNNPSFPSWKCTTSGGCVQQDTRVVLDWNYRSIHQIGSNTPCYSAPSDTPDRGSVDRTLCPDQATCSRNCVVENVDYAAKGVTISGNSMTMRQYVQINGQMVNVNPRVYLLGPDGNYVMMKLNGQELTFDVDLSTLPCGENGALYLSEMSANGGRNQYQTGGPEYGSGYCDAQCPTHSWRNGTLNTSNQGFCCNEMDILESNSRAGVYTAHPCSATDCDRGGCGFNPYSMGGRNFWAPGGTLDTTRPFTVTTQFITNTGAASGTLSEIRRQYIQNGMTIANYRSSGGVDSITDCSSGASFGGLKTMGEALGRGMVLVFSIWNDPGSFMGWLDSGGSGPCSSTEGNPSTILANNPNTHVIFSNVRWGDIGSTFGNPGGSSTSTRVTTSSTSTRPTSTTSTTQTTRTTSTTSTTSSRTSTATGATQTRWGQCGGQGWTGPTVCASPYTCRAQNQWYSQCL